MRRPTHLRPFHQRGDTDSDLPLLRLSSDPDEYSSSEQSCDTVIYVGPNGAAVSDRELTDNEGPPEFVPIIPALLRGKASEQLQTQSQSQTAGVQNKVNYSIKYSSDDSDVCSEDRLDLLLSDFCSDRCRVSRRSRPVAPLRPLSHCLGSRWPPSQKKEGSA